MTYDEQLFNRQLLELLSTLNIRKPVDLVGSSMGGAIAFIFTAQHPEKVRKLLLIDPAGFPVDLPLTGQIGRLPGVGYYLTYVVGNKMMLRGFKNYFSTLDKLSPRFLKSILNRRNITASKGPC